MDISIHNGTKWGLHGCQGVISPLALKKTMVCWEITIKMKMFRTETLLELSGVFLRKQ